MTTPSGLARHLEGWRPTPVTVDDTLTAAPVAALSAVLGLPAPAALDGEPLPPLWHWLHFLDWPAQQALGPDGHPLTGHFLPPVPDRRRMFAGGRLSVHDTLPVGATASRHSSVSKVAVKQGRSGELAFVTVRHEISSAGRLRLTEEQDLVYRSGEDPRRGAPPALATGVPEAGADTWQVAARPGPVTLFRFSALTANAHRIHYDTPYATDVEGYPALVVHGPLLALLMLEAVRRHAPERTVRSLRYRLHRPVFTGEPLLALGTMQDGGPGAVLRVASAREPQHAGAEVELA